MRGAHPSRPRLPSPLARRQPLLRASLRQQAMIILPLLQHTSASWIIAPRCLISPPPSAMDMAPNTPSLKWPFTAPATQRPSCPTMTGSKWERRPMDVLITRPNTPSNTSTMSLTVMAPRDPTMSRGGFSILRSPALPPTRTWTATGSATTTPAARGPKWTRPSARAGRCTAEITTAGLTPICTLPPLMPRLLLRQPRPFCPVEPTNGGITC
mmetsp:Transcript_81984/g.171599  ORF Transcript_81984/g.171599 Transcript_81984/m.171599 type:complete len:212 (+) Transcript_81984:564-1199(+)